MSFYARRFNLYLLPVLALTLATGCASFHKKDKDVAALRIHIESAARAPGVTQTISVLRADPVLVNIVTGPILTEANITAARLAETPGGFAVELKFDEAGSWTLEQYSAANPGKHFAIFGQWGEKLANGRWLAAPLITGRMAGGTLVFTPDASCEEAEQLVKGLNLAARNYAKENK